MVKSFSQYLINLNKYLNAHNSMEVNFIAQPIKQDLISLQDNAIIRANIMSFLVFKQDKFLANLLILLDVFIVFTIFQIMIGTPIKNI